MRSLRSITLISILFVGLTILSGATITGCGKNDCSITIRNNGLPDGVVGIAYSEDMHFDENCFWSAEAEDVVWTVITGSLPPGVSFNNKGHFRGTPALSGTYTFTIEAYHEIQGDTIQKGLSITIYDVTIQ